MRKIKCKICRRVGVKLFLKGEKCFSQKCPFIRRPYPPGPQGRNLQKRRRPLSEYGKQLGERQKLKKWYNLRERQFKNYVRTVLSQGGKIEDAGEALIQKLEKRLDNVVFRLGFASSRSQARQLLSHGHFLVNEKKVNIPSYEVRKGDKIRIAHPEKRPFVNLKITLKKHIVPSWLRLDVDKLEGKVVGEPSFEEAAPPAELSSIFEFYSR